MEPAGAERHRRSSKGERAGARESIEPEGESKPVVQQTAHVDEAGAGIEPANRGFADPDLTTWLPRPCGGERESRSGQRSCQRGGSFRQFGVGRWTLGVRRFPLLT